VIFNLVGGGLGPLLVAFLTDRVFGSGASLRYSLALTAAVLGPLACIIFAYGLAPYRQRIVNTRALDQQPPEASAG
jgi:hypothetical protein